MFFFPAFCLVYFFAVLAPVSFTNTNKTLPKLHHLLHDDITFIQYVDIREYMNDQCSHVHYKLKPEKNSGMNGIRTHLCDSGPPFRYSVLPTIKPTRSRARFKIVRYLIDGEEYE